MREQKNGKNNEKRKKRIYSIAMTLLALLLAAVCMVYDQTQAYCRSRRKQQEEQLEKQNSGVYEMKACISSLELVLSGVREQSAEIESQLDMEQRDYRDFSSQAEEISQKLGEAEAELESLQAANAEELRQIELLQRELETRLYESSVAESSRQESIAASVEASRQESIAASVEASRQESIAASAEASRQESIAASMEAERVAGLLESVDGKTVYITFDDGPSYLTEQVLDILDEYGIKATFFVTYQPQYENMYKEIVSRGHTIGIHTATHDYNKIYASYENWLADFTRVYDYVYQVTGVRAQVYRFPGGSRGTHCNAAVREQAIAYLKSLGIEYFDWNASNGDGASVTKEQSYNNAVTTILPRRHPVLLMHDGPNKETTIASLPGVLRQLKDWGYSFGTLSPEVAPIHQGISWDY